MSVAIEAYPLVWPMGWQRTPERERKLSRYQVSLGRAREGVLRSLALMGVRKNDIVISSNVPLRRDGMLYANASEPHDPGIAVYWTRVSVDAGRRTQTDQRVIACDSWSTVRENLRAIGLTLEALRQLERTGATEILNRAFTGFAALPGNVAEDWRDVLGLRGFRSIAPTDVEVRYRELARDAHPDSGGSHEQMIRLNRAREEALRFLGIG